MIRPAKPAWHKPGAYGDARYKSRMLELDQNTVIRAWSPQNREFESGKSKVATQVAYTFEKDAPFLVDCDDIDIPPWKGDVERAETCFRWLAQKALSYWADSWTKQVSMYHGPKILELVEQIEQEDNITKLNALLQQLQFSLPSSDMTAHRRSLHIAQIMGVRAAYHGATLHPELGVKKMSQKVAFFIAVVVPDQNPPKMLVESLQGSALLLLDSLLKPVK